MNRLLYLPAAAAAMAMAPSVASAASVFGNTSTAQLIGTLAANQAYTVSATGMIGLCSTCNAGGPLSFNPNGIAPNAQGSYSPFATAPQDHDTSQSMGAGYYGLYGPGVYIGALYGSFSAAPTAGDLFLLGYGGTIAASSSVRTLYGVINDTSYSDNQETAFTVTLDRAGTPGAVPEPATWAMMLLGLGGVGYALRRREKVSTRIRFA